MAEIYDGPETIPAHRYEAELEPEPTWPEFATIPETFEYVDRTLATASWWDRYEVAAGTVPIHWTRVDGTPIDDPTQERPYYGVIQAPAILRETYRVNRLFTASSAHTEHPNTNELVWFRFYGYQFAAWTNGSATYPAPYGITFN